MHILSNFAIMQTLPKITIVTPSYNQGAFIEETINSILDQNYPNLEYIIMDGGSTDETVDIIKKYEKHIHYWESKKDGGQSNAINKGLRMASGDLFNWINSDDIVENGALNEIGAIYLENEQPDCIIGSINVIGTENWLYDKKAKRETLTDTLNNIVIKQPSTYYSSTAIKKMGYLNESLHYIMDYEWYFRFLLTHANDSIIEVDTVFSRFRMHDASKTGQDINAFELHKDQFWKEVKLFRETGNSQAFNISSELYNSSIVDRFIAKFFFKRAVNTYAQRQFKEFKEYVDQIDVNQLEKLDKRELNKMVTRQRLIPKIFFNK